MTVRKVLGGAILAAIAIGLFAATCVVGGLWTAVFVWGSAVFLSGAVTFAFWLIDG